MDSNQLGDALNKIVQGRKTIEEMIGTKGKSEFLDQLESQLEIQHGLIRQLNESNLLIEKIVSTFQGDEADRDEKETIVSSIFPHKFFNESGQEMNEMHFPAEILERIFKESGRDKFLSLRPVCSSWNEEVCRLLTMNLGRIHKNSGFPCFSLKICQELYDLLKESLHPGVLIKEVRVSSDVNNPTELPTDMNPFQEFGAYVKRLKIVKDKDLAIIHMFMAQEGHFCPNVEILDYFASESTRPFCPPVFQSHLKLKKLRFETSNEIRISDQAALIVDSILSNSPELTSLTLESYNSQAMTDLCNVLLTKPSVTSNLNKICIKTKLVSHLEQLANCQFSNKLKTVKYQSVFGLGSAQDDYVEPRPDGILEFLTTVAQSLERFEFEVMEVFPRISYFWNFWNRDFFHLPEMPNLKVLSLKKFKLESLEFLAKLPFLKVLNIYSVKVPMIAIMDSIADRHVERLSELQFVHNNLEQVTFEQEGTFIKFRLPATFPLLKNVFPMLTQVHFVMDHPTFWFGKARMIFEKSFHAISQMKNLKALEITINHVALYRSACANFTRAFGYLKELPKLERIIFYRKDYARSCHTAFNFPKEEWLMELLGVPKLHNVEFYGFSMGSKKEYFQERIRRERKNRQMDVTKMRGFGQYRKDIWSEEIVKKFAAKNIILEIRNWQRI